MVQQTKRFDVPNSQLVDIVRGFRMSCMQFGYSPIENTEFDIATAADGVLQIEVKNNEVSVYVTGDDAEIISRYFDDLTVFMNNVVDEVSKASAVLTSPEPVVAATVPQHTAKRGASRLESPVSVAVDDFKRRFLRLPLYARVVIVFVLVAVVGLLSWQVGARVYLKVTNPIRYINATCSKYSEMITEGKSLSDADNFIGEVVENKTWKAKGELTMQAEVTKTRQLFDCVARNSGMPSDVQSEMLKVGSDGEIIWGHYHAKWYYIGDFLKIDLNEVK
ncbi:hypothetical protein JS531_02205 [Bifidobacterium sp. CP2]|uniref:hypothetical protein n=1 Tax=Bifidobacterium TaxID=1678 RepID=UPI001BDDC35F|nr:MULTISPECIES: hypothetical protein [Bifidobacterium]MBT1180802.1 hypothetical protein [Bifidobacterium sp. CP2]MBW3080182.1 hypothetical protein [Bifidobacterium saguinibicoloris]